MRIAEIQFTPWDKIYNFDLNNLNLSENDYVIVKTELGVEIGKVVGFKKQFNLKESDRANDLPNDKNDEKNKIKPIIRKATSNDMAKIPGKEESKKALEYCKKMIRKHELQMKLIDVHFSFEGSRITFVFIADGRIDFRELVKDLTRHFNKVIRLHQIGIRDEAKIMGDYGHCGNKLCCKRFLSNLTSITSEMAETQQVVHRGSERISGICGRLMCCLAYEEENYQELTAKLPPIGAKVNVDGKRGVVLGHNVLKQSVNVEFIDEKGEGSAVVEVDINRNKK